LACSLHFQHGVFITSSSSSRPGSIVHPPQAEQAVDGSTAGLSVVLAVSAASGSWDLSMIFRAVSGGAITFYVRLIHQFRHAVSHHHVQRAESNRLRAGRDAVVSHRERSRLASDSEDPTDAIRHGDIPMSSIPAMHIESRTIRERQRLGVGLCIHYLFLACLHRGVR